MGPYILHFVFVNAFQAVENEIDSATTEFISYREFRIVYKHICLTFEASAQTQYYKFILRFTVLMKTLVRIELLASCAWCAIE